MNVPEHPSSVGEPTPGGAFGPNAWLVDDMYDQFRRDPASVSESWREFFADYVPGGHGGLAGSGSPRAEMAPPDMIHGSGAAEAATNGSAPSASNGHSSSTQLSPQGDLPVAGQIPVVTHPGVPAVEVPADGAADPAVAPNSLPATSLPATSLPAPATGAPEPEAPPQKAVVLAAASRGIAANMEASRGVPTATSVRTIPAKLLQVNRTLLNQHLTRTSGTKVSFTHLIGYAVVKALAAQPSLNSAYVADADGKGHPGVLRHEHVGLGLAVDVSRPDGARTLMVPVIREAERLDFRTFVLAYEELVRKVHAGKISPDDFAGTTVTLTNPGTLGTVQSVPRLMPGQGVIVGVGSIGMPPELQAADPRALAALGVGPVVTITSTYDHRIIQGAESGMFLAHISELLQGG